MTSNSAAPGSAGSTVPRHVSMGRPLALVIRILWLVGIFEAPSELRSGDAAQMISRKVTLMYLKHFPTPAA
jgi:hypothetical protein